MFQPFQYRRMSLICALLLTGMACLECRLVWLQIVRHDELSRKAAAFTEVRRVLPPWRGEIRDRSGVVLAVSQPLVTVWANLAVCTNRPREVARVAGPLLRMGEAPLAEALTPQMNEPASLDGSKPPKAIVLRRRFALEQWEALSNTLAKANFGLSGRILTRSEVNLLRRLRQGALFAEEEQARSYPFAASLAHLTGYVTDPINPPWPKGEFGVEGSLNAVLAGKPGLCVSQRDAAGRELAFRRRHYAAPVDGNDVVLTIDLQVQAIAENALANAVRKHSPQSASVLVMRPRTGEILAWVNWPGLGAEGARSMNPEDWRNHALSDRREPGSTFKIITLAAALNEREVSLDDWVFCGNGRFTTNRVTVHDHGRYGWLTLREAVIKSSNVAFAKIALKLGAQRLHRYLLDFGFGRVTGIPLVFETPGYIPSLNTLSQWVTLLRVGFGQGLAVSQLQMTVAVCAICNDGRLMKPMLISHVASPDGRVLYRAQPQLVRAVVSPYAARQVREALQGVLSDEGTGARARLASYTGGGKTGTAQKSDAAGYLPDRYYASFIGFFPLDQPEICISVALDEPRNGYYGGTVAAPVFREIAERVGVYLGIPPDKRPAPGQRVSPEPDDSVVLTLYDPDTQPATPPAERRPSVVRVSRP